MINVMCGILLSPINYCTISPTHSCAADATEQYFNLARAQIYALYQKYFDCS